MASDVTGPGTAAYTGDRARTSPRSERTAARTMTTRDAPTGGTSSTRRSSRKARAVIATTVAARNRGVWIIGGNLDGALGPLKDGPGAGLLLALLLLAASWAPGGPGALGAVPARAQERAEERRRMVRELASEAPFRTAVDDSAVLAAMRSVPRHRLVPRVLREAAYEDRPLPIGHGQTISQPWVVARMTELLRPEPGDTVLEVGTGSGYQAAVLAEIVDHVFTVEIVGDLARSARRKLRRLGYGNVTVRHGDGYRGWPEHAPFDGIVVTAAPEQVPPPLVEQLAAGARMVVPVGPQGRGQALTVLHRRSDGTVERRVVSAVRFVPMTRDTASGERSSR